MTATGAHLPSSASVRRLLAELGHAGARFSVHDLPGSFSNFTHLIKIEQDDSPARKIVMRRYNPANYDEDHDKPLCEYHALQLLQTHGIPAPPPLLLDESGELLGLPGIVTEFFEGKSIELPADAWRWGEKAEKTARMLARIHLVPFTEADKRYLMDDNVEVSWYIKAGTIPHYMRADPDGEIVWHLVNDHWGRWKPVESRFAHTDYWSGNILWHDDEISAVVDWEEAGYGHPAADVAYCRMGYFIEGIPEAAVTFLNAYEAEAGWTLTDLPFFELAASARPMMDPDDWFAHPYMAAGFRRFIAQAKQKLLAEN